MIGTGGDGFVFGAFAISRITIMTTMVSQDVLKVTLTFKSPTVLDDSNPEATSRSWDEIAMGLRIAQIAMMVFKVSLKMRLIAVTVRLLFNM